MKLMILSYRPAWIVRILPLLALSLAVAVPMQGAAFLKFEGIEGESKDKAHRDEIEVFSWSWGLRNSGTTHTATGGGSGKVSVSDFTITKRTDKASPKLALRTASGLHAPSAKLTVYRESAAGERVPYLVFEFENVIVTSYQTSGSRTEIPEETITLNFARFTYTYTPTEDDGSAGAPVSVGWDIQKNEEV